EQRKRDERLSRDVALRAQNRAGASANTTDTSVNADPQSAADDPPSSAPSARARISLRKRYDVFICHASEDKHDVARPLAEALTARGARVWLDELEMKVGDSLRLKIDDGLRLSRFGVVVLSPSFFDKRWTQ